ncbi:MAG: phosphoglucosamine mutase, partial [Oscillospiraceae bacterium]
KVAPSVFRELGADVTVLSAQPDGLNINDNCGSTHIDSLAPRVVAGGYDLGLAFDGDADRLLAVDERGTLLDGDVLLATLSEHLTARKRLAGNAVVVTSMTNLGFLKLMKERGRTVDITGVGDRYVLESMRRHGYSLGGEQSGHMIFLDIATTGDGQLSAIMLLNALADSGRPLSELAGVMRRFPQTIQNVPATASMKAALGQNAIVAGEIARWETILEGRGRVMVRASGTEPFIRVMIEGEDQDEIENAARTISNALCEHLI